MYNCSKHEQNRGVILKIVWKAIIIASIMVNIIGLAGGGYIAIKAGWILKGNDTQTYPINYYIQKGVYDKLSVSENDIVFFGDSLTDFGQWNEVLSSPKKVLNRGIMGDDTERLLGRVNEVGNPSKVFIMAGINDLINGEPLDQILSNYKNIVTTISKNSPKTKIYIESVLPVDNIKFKDSYKTKKSINPNDVILMNDQLKLLVQEFNGVYVDLYDSFSYGDVLRSNYTSDGIHLTSEGYNLWASLLIKHVND
jgi:lysophospholipase L1-like esterase